MILEDFKNVNRHESWHQVTSNNTNNLSHEEIMQNLFIIMGISSGVERNWESSETYL